MLGPLVLGGVIFIIVFLVLLISDYESSGQTTWMTRDLWPNFVVSCVSGLMGLVLGLAIIGLFTVDRRNQNTQELVYTQEVLVSRVSYDEGKLTLYNRGDQEFSFFADSKWATRNFDIGKKYIVTYTEKRKLISCYRK